MWRAIFVDEWIFQVLSRRDITTETTASAALSSITKECRAGYSAGEISMLEHRNQKEIQELEREVHCDVNNSLSLPGRQSGAIEWRIARSEVGSNGNNSLSSSSCPVRICVDSHVRNIYNALYLLLHQFFDVAYQKNEIIQDLTTLRRLLVDLRTSPFKERRTVIDSNFSQFSDTLMTCIEGFLSSISLKWELENGGNICVCLAGDPILTSLALPVALDAVDEITNSLNTDDHFGKNNMEFPKLSRLTSGFVLASGEELPTGIVSNIKVVSSIFSNLVNVNLLQMMYGLYGYRQHQCLMVHVHPSGRNQMELKVHHL